MEMDQQIFFSNTRFPALSNCSLWIGITQHDLGSLLISFLDLGSLHTIGEECLLAFILTKSGSQEHIRKKYFRTLFHKPLCSVFSKFQKSHATKLEESKGGNKPEETYQGKISHHHLYLTIQLSLSSSLVLFAP